MLARWNLFSSFSKNKKLYPHYPSQQSTMCLLVAQRFRVYANGEKRSLLGGKTTNTSVARVVLRRKKKSWKSLQFIAFSLRVDSWSSLNRNFLESLAVCRLPVIRREFFLLIREHLRVSLSLRDLFSSSPRVVSIKKYKVRVSAPNNNVDDAQRGVRRDLCLILLILLCNLQCSDARLLAENILEKLDGKKTRNNYQRRRVWSEEC